jgi:hypothetical protein
MIYFSDLLLPPHHYWSQTGWGVQYLKDLLRNYLRTSYMLATMQAVLRTNVDDVAPSYGLFLTYSGGRYVQYYTVLWCNIITSKPLEIYMQEVLT